jgi:hypothetical protein
MVMEGTDWLENDLDTEFENCDFPRYMTSNGHSVFSEPLHDGLLLGSYFTADASKF